MPKAEVEQPVVAPVTRYNPHDSDQKKAVQAFKDSSSSFARNFLDIQPGKPVGSRVDPVTADNLNKVLRLKRTRPYPPATVINIHPWKIGFGASADPLLRNRYVEACKPGESFNFAHIRHIPHESFYGKDDGSRDFKLIPPIRIAGEFIREFGAGSVYRCGVLIYEGESHPDKVKMVETYDPRGTLISQQQTGVEYDEEEREQNVVIEVPIKRDFQEMLEQEVRMRNEVYMREVQTADAWAKSEKIDDHHKITDQHRLMAEVLLADGVLAAMPEWNLASRAEKRQSGKNCPACGEVPMVSACKCSNCANILDPVAAYRESVIEYGHVSMDRLSVEQWLEVDSIKAERDEVKAKVEKARSKGK